MKLEKSTSRSISFLMSICIISISVLVFVIIYFSLQKVYLNTLEDMTSVATDNIQELIEINKNEAIFITQMESFIQYTDLLTNQIDPTELERYKTQTFDYIRKKAEISTSINKITIVDFTNKVISSSDPVIMNKKLSQSAFYEDGKNNGLGSIVLKKNSYEENVVLITYPVKQYERHYGYVFIEVNFNFIEPYINHYHFGSTGNLFLITKDCSFIGKNSSQLPSGVEDISKNYPILDLANNQVMGYDKIYSTDFQTDQTNRYMVYRYIKNLDAILATSIEKSEVNKTALTTALPLFFLLVVILVLIIVYRFIISVKILHPISLLNRSLHFLKKGDLRARYNYNANNEFGKLSTIFNQTISNLQKTTHDLKERELKNNILLSNITDAIWEYNLSENVIEMPENWAKLVGYEYFKHSYTYTVEEFIEFVHINDAKELDKNVQNCIAFGQPIQLECQIKRVDNKYIWIKINGNCLYNAYNEPYKIIGSISDISEIKSRERELINTTKRDDMTKFYNKREIEIVIDLDLARATYPHYLLIIDIDGFKLINDTYGHLVGDRVILHTAQVIRKHAQETCEICRFGGDEFVLYTKDKCTLADVEALATNIIKNLNQGYTLEDGNNIYLACSIGISQFPTDGTTYVGLMEKADLAVYHAKHNDKNRYVVYDESLYR